MKWEKTAGLCALLAGSFVLGRTSAPSSTVVLSSDRDFATEAEASSEESARPVPLDLEPSPPEARRSVAETTVATDPRSSGIREVSVCEAFAILSEALRDHPLGNADDRSFCEKYRGATLEQFQVARALVRKRYEADRQRIVDERLRDGPYEVRFENEEPLSVTTVEGGGPVSFGFQQELRDGSLVTRATIIPAKDDPAFRSLELEWSWLERQARGLGSLDCDR